MAATHLKGTSRTALLFIKERWIDLIQISLVPFVLQFGLGLLYAAIIVVPMTMMGSENNLNLVVFLVLIFFNIVNMLLSNWLYVRVVRLYLLGEKPWIGLDKAAFTLSLRCLFYSLMMGLFIVGAILVVTYILVLISTNLITIILPDQDFIRFFISNLATALVLVLFVWLSCRLFVGLPSVALGQRPHILRDIWPLAQRDGWALSWRLSLIIFIGCIVLSLLATFIIGLSTALLMTDSPEQPQTDGIQALNITQDSPLAFLLPMGILLAGLPLMWLVFLVLTESYYRLTTGTSSR